MRIKEKIGNFVDENGKIIIATTGCVLITLGVGYVLGCKNTEFRLSYALERVFEKNPEIKTLMDNAIKELNKK